MRIFDLMENNRRSTVEKEDIRQYCYSLGADVVGFAAVGDYQSKRAPDPKTILTGVQSLVVMGYRENNGAVESENRRISMASRMGGMELSLKNSYLVTRYIEDKSGTRAAPVSFSYPLNMEPPVMGLVGDVSLRHAAVAAGLGVFGRHNLVINPRFGTRIIFTAVLSELALGSDPPVEEELCDQCEQCVDACPVNALDQEGRTDALKCLGSSQPYGITGMLQYIGQIVGKSPEEQKKLLGDPRLMSLYQAQIVGFQYMCWNCMAACPACI